MNPAPIRIAYVLNTEVRAGVEEHVLSLVARIDRSRFSPYVVAPPKLIDAFGDDLVSTGARVLPLTIGGSLDIGGMKRFWSYLRREQIDIVNTHMFQASFRFSPLAWLAGTPVRLETSHGVEKWRLSKGFIKRNSFLVDRFFSFFQTGYLAVSHACAEDLVTVKGIDRELIHVVQNGRDLSQFSPEKKERRDEIRARHGVAPGDHLFGVMARLDMQKGHSYLLDAVAALDDSADGFKVILVGGGNLEAELKAKAAALHIEDRVIFAGFQRDVVGYYSAFDSMVLPSLYEGLPLCAIEAMAMGLPVIATAVDGTPEVVKEGVSGILVPARDPAALFRAMRAALTDREGMRRLGGCAREWVTEHFTLERQIAETERLYLKLTANLLATAGDGKTRLAAEKKEQPL